MATNFSLAISDLIFGVLVVCHQKHNKLAKRIEKGLKTRKRLPKRAESLWVSVSPSVQKFPALMACNGSLPCSQQPVTRPFPEPDKSSPHCPISDFFQTHFFSPSRLLRLLVNPFTHVSRPKLCMHLS